jgi:hypothetical protein
MRLSLAGGDPQQVFARKDLRSIDCGTRFCAASTAPPDGQELTIWKLDPEKGLGPQILRLKPGRAAWALERNGSRLAYVLPTADVIQIVDENGKPQREVRVRDLQVLNLEWASDGKGFYVIAHGRNVDTQAVHHVALNGNTKLLYEGNLFVILWALPSLDGSQLAIQSGSTAMNVWQVENL